MSSPRSKRALPAFITSKIITYEKEDIPTSQSSSSQISSQSSDCAPGFKEITREVLLDAKSKLEDYVAREDPSQVKHDPKYEGLSQTPTSSQVSIEEINLSQQSFADEISLELLVQYFFDVLGSDFPAAKSRIKTLLKNLVHVPSDEQDSREDMHSFLVHALNQNAMSALILVDECLALSRPTKRAKTTSSEAGPAPPPTP
jgi:hypothetical protein